MKENPVRKLKNEYEKANLNFKKEAINLLLCVLLLIGMAIFMAFYLNNFYISFVGILFLALGAYLLIDKPKRVLSKRRATLENEFVHVFAYFAIFIRNGKPVYNALEDCLRYSSEGMSEKIKTLLEEVDNDKSITPYMHFADNFDNLEIKQVLVSIYKMSIEGGGDEYLRQFETIFYALSSSKRQSRLEEETNKFSNYNFLPLIASALSMGIIAVAVVILLEEYSNVI